VGPSPTGAPITKGGIEMKILDVWKIKGYNVETNGQVFYSYTRYSSDNWYVRMGESDEPVYDCEEIEALFQEYIKTI